MTEEDCFQTALDSDPSDQVTRLVFADWLAERDDDRAEGMRALAFGEYRPWPGGRRIDGVYYWWYWGRDGCGDLEVPSAAARREGEMPGVWWHKLQLPRKGKLRCRVATTLREMYDAAARAWLKLTETERAEILAGATCPSVTQ